jgi:hypothetical protein
MKSEDTIVYDIDLKNILKKLDDCDLAAIQDPKGVSGYVYASSSDSKKKEALSKLSTARIRAEKARNEENAANTRLAFEWWDKVFAGNFPSYYY